MERQAIHEGMKVHSADGSSLGKVSECGLDRFVIEKGWFFHKEYNARYEQIARVEGDEIWLRESGQQLSEQVGRAEPERAAGMAAPLGTSERERLSTGAGMVEEYRIPLAEEELTAETHQREAGQVRIHKEVVTEEREVTVPVMHEEVRVDRVSVEAGAQTSSTAFEEADVTIPVHEEEVEIHKRPVVREEVRVTKEPHVEQERRVVSVRKERADISREGDIPPPSQR